MKYFEYDTETIYEKTSTKTTLTQVNRKELYPNISESFYKKYEDGNSILYYQVYTKADTPDSFENIFSQLFYNQENNSLLPLIYSIIIITNTGLILLKKSDETGYYVIDLLFDKDIYEYDDQKKIFKKNIVELSDIDPDISFFDNYSRFQDPLICRTLFFKDGQLVPERSFIYGDKKYSSLDCDYLFVNGSNVGLSSDNNGALDNFGKQGLFKTVSPINFIPVFNRKISYKFKFYNESGIPLEGKTSVKYIKSTDSSMELSTDGEQLFFFNALPDTKKYITFDGPTNSDYFSFIFPSENLDGTEFENTGFSGRIEIY